MKIKFPKQPPLSAAAQAVALQHQAPFGYTTLRRNGLNWRGTMCPSEFGREYAVELDYLIGATPKVWVRDPNLRELSGGRKLPHVYEQKTQRLCLYLPGCGFWHPALAVARTMLPWSSLWLYNFEIWLVTDIWHTQGRHPDVAPRVSAEAHGAILF